MTNHVPIIFIFTFFSHIIITYSQSATIYKTIQATNDRLTPYKQAFIDSNKILNADIMITINPSITYQSMLGFGGAFTPSSSYLFSLLNSTTQQNILSMYFSDNGQKYNMARLTIGSCDFALMSYNFAPYPNDYNLTNFKLTQYDNQHIIPFIKQSLHQFHNSNYSNSTDFMFIASPWSAPGWMKDNNAMTCGMDTCLLCKLKDNDLIHTTYSKYISKYITEYSNALNYNIYAITPQNEPYACPTFYEGMHFSPKTEGDFIAKHLGPILKHDHPDLKIYIYDQNKGGMIQWIQEIILNNTEAAKYVSGTAVHWYDGDHFDALNESHFLAPNYEILATEATESPDNDATTNPKWKKGEHYAHDMIGDFNNWVIGFIDWNLLLDIRGAPTHQAPDLGESNVEPSLGSDAMLIVDPLLNEIYPQIFYFYVGHFSRFVSKYDYRIEWNMKNITTNNSDIEMTAFYDSNKDVVSVIIMNPTDKQWVYKLNDVRNVDKFLNGTIVPHSIQTIVY
eukprot:437020_1